MTCSLINMFIDHFHRLSGEVNDIINVYTEPVTDVIIRCV